MRWIPPFFYPSLFFSFLLSFLYSTEIILKTYSVPGILLHLILITQSPRSGIIFSWLFTLNSAILFFKTQFSCPPLQCAYQDSTKLSRCPSFVPAWNSLLPPIAALSHSLTPHLIVPTRLWSLQGQRLLHSALYPQGLWSRLSVWFLWCEMTLELNGGMPAEGFFRRLEEPLFFTQVIYLCCLI